MERHPAMIVIRPMAASNLRRDIRRDREVCHTILVGPLYRGFALR
jgi:hypothetical protein